MTPPLNPEAISSLRHALGQLRAGYPRVAEALAREGLLSAPSHPSWLSVLGLALSADKRPDDALPVYRELTVREPGAAGNWSNLGNCLCELGREHEALQPLERALALGADHAAVHFALARVYSVTGPARLGLAHIVGALQQEPEDLEFRLLHAKLLNAMDEWEQAKHEIDALLQMPLDTPQRVELGYLLLRGGIHMEAQELFTNVLRRVPEDVDARLGAITALERINRVDEAVAQRAILAAQLDPSSELRLREKLLQVDARLAARNGDHALAVEHLQALLADHLADPALRISLRFDLGIALDKCGRVDEAMTAFALAHAERRALVADDHPALGRGDSLYVALEQPPVRMPGWLKLPEDAADRDPVFVVGFPRSGTTLLEQLLDAHDSLASFDEQPFVQRLVKRLNDRNDSLQLALDALGNEGVRELRKGYFSDIGTVVPDLGPRRPVDKNPLNLVRLSVLAPFFPHGQVILALRHPCDVVLSCYMQNFRAPSFAVAFETLESCAEMYHRVFAYWWQMREDFALPVHALRYEDLVANTEAEARRLFDFLKLQWDPALLQFTERARSKGTISTPSYAQVIEPVNPKAIDRWHAYRHHFSDRAMDFLAPWVERFGYAR